MKRHRSSTRGTNQPVATNWVVTKLGGFGLRQPIVSISSAVGSADGTGGGALFYLPEAIAVDKNATIYLSDAGSQTIRRGAPVIVMDLSPPIISNAAQVQVPFLLENGLPGTFKLLQSGQIGSHWTTNSAAVFTTNRSRFIYTFTAARPASNQFYRVQMP